MRLLTYLACPYTHPKPEVRAERFRKVTVAAAELSKNGKIVFSPITHSHPMTEFAIIPSTWSFWKEIDEAYLSVSKEVIVLTLDDWEFSIGVRAEVELAKQMQIPVTYMAYEFG